MLQWHPKSLMIGETPLYLISLSHQSVDTPRRGSQRWIRLSSFRSVRKLGVSCATGLEFRMTTAPFHTHDCTCSATRSRQSTSTKYLSNNYRIERARSRPGRVARGRADCSYGLTHTLNLKCEKGLRLLLTVYGYPKCSKCSKMKILLVLVSSYLLAPFTAVALLTAV